MGTQYVKDTTVVAKKSEIDDSYFTMDSKCSNANSKYCAQSILWKEGL
jgi:hypothetical protein